jgi:hypothetical protein
MKIWVNFRFRDTLQQAWLSVKRLEPVLRQTRAALLVTWSMTAAMLKYIHTWHPRRYFVVYHKGYVTDIILYEEYNGGIKETVRTVKHAQELDSVLREMSHLSHAPLLYEAGSIPIMVAVQGVECDIKTFDLNKVPFWKRREVVKHVEHTLAQSEIRRSAPSWIQKAYIRYSQQDVGGVKVTARHMWFGVLKMNASLGAFEDWLQQQKRPVMSAHWAPLMLAEHLWTSLPNVAPWTIFVCPYEGGGFQLFVYHHRAMVLYRQGFLNTFVDSTIHDEVKQTLQYIERFGYAPGTHFRVVLCDFDESHKIKAASQGEWIWRKMPENKDWLVQKTKHWWDIWFSFLKKPFLSQAELSPRRFVSAWMAYRLPKNLCAIGVPFIHVMFWMFVVLWMKSNYLSHTLHTVEPLMGKDARSVHLDGRMMHATCFDMFRQIYAHQPLLLLSKITPLLGQTGVIQRIHYDGSKQTEQVISFYFSGKMSKETQGHIKKSLGENQHYVEYLSLGVQNVLHVTERY